MYALAGWSIALSAVFLCSLCVLLIYRAKQRVRLEKNRCETLERLIHLQEEKYREMSESVSQIRKIIHDTKKHLLFIKRGVDQQNFDVVTQYMQKVGDKFSGNDLDMYTGNLAIDAMVGNLYHQAEDMQIAVETDIRLGRETVSLDEYDLCILLGNLFDNAVEACGRMKKQADRKIEVSIYNEGCGLAIAAKNTINAEEEVDFQRSRKDNQYFHGYGVKNIRDIVEGHGGTMKLHGGDQCVEVVLYVPYAERKKDVW